jgi:hypothetical protein
VEERWVLNSLAGVRFSFWPPSLWPYRLTIRTCDFQSHSAGLTPAKAPILRRVDRTRHCVRLLSGSHVKTCAGSNPASSAMVLSSNGQGRRTSKAAISVQIRVGPPVCFAHHVWEEVSGRENDHSNFCAASVNEAQQALNLSSDGSSPSRRTKFL